MICITRVTSSERCLAMGYQRLGKQWQVRQVRVNPKPKTCSVTYEIGGNGFFASAVLPCGIGFGSRASSRCEGKISHLFVLN
jgi:hypothetical protein